MRAPTTPRYPSAMSLVVTAVVALVLFAGVVTIAKRLPLPGTNETTGAASKEVPAPKASDRAPVDPNKPASPNSR